ncbi:DUF365 domain-containing protein [Methanobacterium sp.]|uniref:DUF365 domain-containing protein n=1 Tax=Methanobacterium sp. TaxID=2164 RepID=UPI0031589E32
MKIAGVTHPIPTEYANKIYEDKKTVFIGKSYLGKVSKGDKFVVYESYGAKAYTGYGTIKFIGKVKTNQILKKYKDKLIINEEEFKKYSKNKNEMTIIEFENFKRFKDPVVPKRFVTIAGKYIYEDEYNDIIKKGG